MPCRHSLSSSPSPTRPLLQILYLLDLGQECVEVTQPHFSAAARHTPPVQAHRRLLDDPPVLPARAHRTLGLRSDTNRYATAQAATLDLHVDLAAANATQYVADGTSLIAPDAGVGLRTRIEDTCLQRDERRWFGWSRYGVGGEEDTECVCQGCESGRGCVLVDGREGACGFRRRYLLLQWTVQTKPRPAGP